MATLLALRVPVQRLKAPPARLAWIVLTLGCMGIGAALAGATLWRTSEHGADIVAAGLALTVLGGLLGWGLWLHANRVNAAVAEMQAGAVLASWTCGSERYDVGPKLAIRNGRALPYGLPHQEVNCIKLVGHELHVEGRNNDGEGGHRFVVRLGFDDGTLEAARAAGRELATHHSVRYVENAPAT